jgi:hypothetical protein
MLELKPNTQLVLQPRILEFTEEDGVQFCSLENEPVFKKLRELSREKKTASSRAWPLTVTYYDVHGREFETHCTIEVSSDLGDVSTRAFLPIGRLVRVPV